MYNSIVLMGIGYVIVSTIIIICVVFLGRPKKKEQKEKDVESFYQNNPFPITELDKERLDAIYKNGLGIGDFDFKNRKILDAGCGSGVKTRYFKAFKGTKVTSIDIADTIVKDAKKMSVLDMKFKDNTFDLVNCVGVLHHTTNPRKGFKECCRVTKNCGTVIVALYNKDNIIYPFFFKIFRHIPKSVMWIIWKTGWKIVGTKQTKEQLFNLMLDQWYTPIAYFFSRKEIMKWFMEENIYLICTTGSGYFGFLPDNKRAMIYYIGVKDEI